MGTKNPPNWRTLFGEHGNDAKRPTGVHQCLWTPYGGFYEREIQNKF